MANMLLDFVDLLEKTQPEDIVLADRRVDVVDTLGLLQESLKALAFTRGKCLPKLWRTPKTLQIFEFVVFEGRVFNLFSKDSARETEYPT